MTDTHEIWTSWVKLRAVRKINDFRSGMIIITMNSSNFMNYDWLINAFYDHGLYVRVIQNINNFTHFILKKNRLNFHNRCSGKLHSLVPPVQIFTSRSSQFTYIVGSTSFPSYSIDKDEVTLKQLLPQNCDIVEQTPKRGHGHPLFFL